MRLARNQKRITLILKCKWCHTEHLHFRRAVGLKTGVNQQVQTVCLGCGKSVTR